MVPCGAVLWRRLLRKRWVLGVVFGLSLVYFISSTFKQEERMVRDRTLLQVQEHEQPIMWKQHLLERFLNRAAMAFQNLFMAVEDHFELCLAKCRTSSQSVQHENTYRDPIAKHCYGEYPPELLPV
ncbi:SREBP regulating gene protein isoform X3 [Ammospiza caudacuta]|uniref:SREBP regulating gene protein isoform X3 n=1 Tax=Ammospiza caudacuta TaxID=2857398 RepID=UPI0027399E1E|nr:SREBP regulating gene protein isoform X3 [Ammospiza caudacuta]